MRRQSVLVAAATAALVFAVPWAEPTGRIPATPPVAVPVLLDGASANTIPPPHWIPKQPGHYSATDWRRVIDSTWGLGLPVSEKLAIFDMFWDTMDAKYACFNNLDVNWDSLRSVYRPEIEDTVSCGRFAAIMNHLGMALRDVHTFVRDSAVNWGTQLLPGVPLWVIGGSGDVGHFGAGLTPLPDSSLLVYRVAPSHPLGLERGDVVLGYDRRRWTDIVQELSEAELPIHMGYIYGSCSTAMTHQLLNAAGENWHLFDTIDIVKYATGDTVHLPTSLLATDSMHLFATEQLDIPGVSMPGPDSVPAVTFGIINGRLIGYIYGWRWQYHSRTEFYGAISALLRISTLKGIIIDFRFNEGGGFFQSNQGLRLLFRDSTPTICFSERSSPGNHYSMTIYDPGDANTIPGNGIGYDKPIAVLVGPAAVSSGDHVAYRMTFHPRVRTFGKSISTTFNSPTWIGAAPGGWYMNYAIGEASPVADPTYYLTRREFPVDVPVWHTRDAVARGEDTVVTAAMAWIDSVAAGVEEAPRCEVQATDVPTIVHGVLFLPRDMTELPCNSDRVPRPQLLDVAGRKAMELKPGPNDVSRLSPGVYFVCQAFSVKRDASSVIKVILQK